MAYEEVRKLIQEAKTQAITIVVPGGTPNVSESDPRLRPLKNGLLKLSEAMEKLLEDLEKK